MHNIIDMREAATAARAYPAGKTDIGVTVKAMTGNHSLAVNVTLTRQDAARLLGDLAYALRLSAITREALLLEGVHQGPRDSNQLINGLRDSAILAPLTEE